MDLNVVDIEYYSTHYLHIYVGTDKNKYKNRTSRLVFIAYLEGCTRKQLIEFEF